MIQFGNEALTSQEKARGGYLKSLGKASCAPSYPVINHATTGKNTQ